MARYFAWHPDCVEGVNPHWRVDCFVRKHELADKPEKLAKALVSTLIESGRCDTPVWLSWHTSEVLGGEARGELWELD